MNFPRSCLIAMIVFVFAALIAGEIFRALMVLP